MRPTGFGKEFESTLIKTGGEGEEEEASEKRIVLP